jgi:hypothetical protein
MEFFNVKEFFSTLESSVIFIEMTKIKLNLLKSMIILLATFI